MGRCESCVAIANATSLDVIEMDAASNNSVDDIRELRESVQYAPVSGRCKVYILDEAHMLSPQAWNAFLKTLEEPPPHTIFVLATTEAQKVLPTVVDRCHRFDFARPTVEQIATVITRVAAAEGIEIAPDAVALLARHATGSFRDALGTLEQLVTYTGTDIATDDVLAVLGVADADLLFGALDAVAAGDARAAWLAAARLAETGRDIAQFLKDLEAHARDLLVVQTLGEVPPELRLTPDRDERLAEQAARIARVEPRAPARPPGRGPAHGQGRRRARTRLEAALVKAAAPEVDPAARALMARVERLEAALSGAAAAPAQPPRAVPEPPRAVPDRLAPRRSPPRRNPPLPRRPPRRQAPSTRRAKQREACLSPRRRSTGERARARADRGSRRGSRARAAPTPTATAVADPDLDAVRTLWPAVLDAVRADNGLLAACLAEAHPVEVRGSEVVVAFAEHDTFNRKMADGREHRATVDDALRDLAGSALRVVFELRELRAGAPRSSRPPRTSSWHASRRSSTPRRSSPTIRNRRARRTSPDAAAAEHAADAQAGPEDAGGHGGRPGAAQERGGRGVGRRRHGHRKVTGDLVVKAMKIAPEASIPTIPSCCRTWSWPPPTRRCARPRSSAARLGGLTGGMDLGSLGLPGF